MCHKMQSCNNNDNVKSNNIQIMVRKEKHFVVSWQLAVAWQQDLTNCYKTLIELSSMSIIKYYNKNNNTSNPWVWIVHKRKELPPQHHNGILKWNWVITSNIVHERIQPLYIIYRNCRMVTQHIS